MVFDIKMEGFGFTAWLIAGDNMTKEPASITNVSVVSREAVRKALMISVLKDLEREVGQHLKCIHSCTSSRNG